MSETNLQFEPTKPRKLRLATVSLAGCFGCHTSFLDMDERILALVEHVQFDRSPLTDIKEVGECDIGLIEGGVCNAENVHVLRAYRAHCRVLVAVGACAVNGGLPAMRNHLDVGDILRQVYLRVPGGAVPDDVELPLPLAQVHPIHEVVRVDYSLPGCPPSADVFWKFLQDFLHGQTPLPQPQTIHYD